MTSVQGFVNGSNNYRGWIFSRGFLPATAKISTVLDGLCWSSLDDFGNHFCSSLEQMEQMIGLCGGWFLESLSTLEQLLELV